MTHRSTASTEGIPMKRTLLFSALVFASHGAFAADATPKAKPVPDVHVDVHADANVRAEPRVEADVDSKSVDAKTTAARAELAELRTQMQSLSRRMADLSSQLGDVGPRAYAYRYISQPDRAMVGVVLGRNKDHDGVHINAVTPDGPAARAGLRDGDVITAIDQHPIAAGDADAALKQARERLANLKESQSVSIEYLRGKEKGVVVVEAARREAWNWPAMINDDPDHPFLPKDFNERVRADVERATRSAERAAMDSEHVRAIAEHARNEALHANNKNVHAAMEAARSAMRRGMPWWGINLAPVDADLGRYFGTDKGALVLSADDDSLPGLRAGDVITTVAGEAVARPEDVMRSLRDQPAGKDVAIKLMRDRKQLALNVKAPEFKSIFSMPPMPPAPPMSATPPSPPAARGVPSPPSPPAAPPPPLARVAVPAPVPAPAAKAAPVAVPSAQAPDDD
jgi:hypothetical protein